MNSKSEYRTFLALGLRLKLHQFCCCDLSKYLSAVVRSETVTS